MRNEVLRTRVTLSGGLLKISRSIAVRQSAAWNCLTDTSEWQRWGVSLRKVECGDRFIQTGSKGRVKTILGLWLPFTIASFEPPKYWDWHIGRFAATGHRVEAEGEHSCSVAFTMPWWAVFYLPVCLIALCRIENLCTAKVQTENK